MNNYYFILLSVLCAPAALHSSPACLDNSKHLAERYDSGEYYLVSQGPHGPCLCPCEKQYDISPDRGKCWKCHHYRVPKPQVIQTVNTNVVVNNKKIINIPKLARVARMRNKSNV